MSGMLGNITRMTELRQRLLFLLGALLVFRVGTFIPVPGVNPAALLQFMDQQRGTIIDMFNTFSGGALGRFSLFALGIMPYISASIIIQLMTSAVPQLQQLRKEGESGRRKITQYTRYFTLILAVFQSVSVALALQQQTAGAGMPVVINPGTSFLFSAMVSLTAGTMFLMWLGEQITERGVGNGISMIIFAGIVAGLPSAITSTLELARTGQLGIMTVIFFLIMAVVVTAFVVFVERGQRRITVNYAQKQGGRRAYQNASSHLPLKVNMSGVIPAIFASSLVLFPATMTQWFGQGSSSLTLQRIANWLAPGQPAYLILYGALIIFFCFFYTAIVFNSKETADNLKRSGAFIPGIRPGRHTADYLDVVLTRLTAVGAAYLTAVCLLPNFLVMQWNVPFFFGGTSLLIIVVVIMDFIAQVNNHLVTHQYDSVLKKANLKNYGRSGSVVRR
ncbi:MAG: preprotein translocase subunit SecY [Gammaproteobacteria bacterium]|nr:preprotein translocase subunit SecY [Gammaproteobacteria bacterium]